MTPPLRRNGKFSAPCLGLGDDLLHDVRVHRHLLHAADLRGGKAEVFDSLLLRLLKLIPASGNKFPVCAGAPYRGGGYPAFCRGHTEFRMPSIRPPVALSPPAGGVCVVEFLYTWKFGYCAFSSAANRFDMDFITVSNATTRSSRTSTRSFGASASIFCLSISCPS